MNNNDNWKNETESDKVSMEHSSCVASVTSDDEKVTQCGFEGPEKLIEIWFKPPMSTLDQQTRSMGLRAVDRSHWEDMLKIVRCQVLSVISNDECDAYLLSESSMFVYANRLMIKTCGTTMLLNAVSRILQIASRLVGMHEIEAFFYSRKSFLYPERQAFPHGKWSDEVTFLDAIFPCDAFDTSGYVVGKLNGDHWCLYTCCPGGMDNDGNKLEESSNVSSDDDECDDCDDVTLEILMSDLDSEAMKHFWRTEAEKQQATLPENLNVLKQQLKGAEHRVSTETGIADIYPGSKVDDYVFDPCGYSLNGLVGPYYYTIHVTPEDICSYASFETTVPVKALKRHHEQQYHSFKQVIEKVVQCFQPGRFSTTLFVRHNAMKKLKQANHLSDEGLLLNDAPIEGFRRRDRIHHHLGQWDVVFCHFDQTKSRRNSLDC